MINILLADDHAIVRMGIRQILLDEFPSAQIVEVAGGEQLISQITHQKWDVVVSDLTMPGVNGFDALIKIRQMAPKLPVLIMSMQPEDQWAIKLLKAGASGYLNKESLHSDLIPSIHTVLLGKKYITSSLAEKLTDSLGENWDKLMHESLSRRELEVLILLAKGYTVTAIAEQLSLSITTISTYRTRIMEKMDLKSNADVMRYARDNNLIT
jgi:two-component system, NarL family, invasion response regulator UvrY